MIKKRKISPYILTIFISFWYSLGVIYADSDISWYKNNYEILNNNSVISDIFRAIGWGILKLVCMVADLSQELYNKTFGLIDITNYESISSLITRFKPVLVALTVLCVIVYGLILIVTNEKKPIISNIILGILSVSCSIYLFSTANSLIKEFKNGVLESNTTTQSYNIVNNNVIDLIGIDKRGNISSLNYDAGNGIIHNAGITNKRTMDEVDINQVLNWDDSDEGKDLFNWTDTFNEYITYRAVKVEGQYIKMKNYDGVLNTTIGNNFFYRYDFDFWSTALQLVSLMLVFLALAYKNVRIAYELVVARILSLFYSADIGGGQKLRGILAFIRDTYITMAIAVLCVKLYQIFTEAITGFGINGIAKGIVSLFIAFAVIDGPNLVERLLGMDAGLKSSFGRSIAIFGMARGMMRNSKNMAKGVRGAFNTAKTGYTTSQRRQMRGNPTTGDIAGQMLRKAMGKPINMASENNVTTAPPVAYKKPKLNSEGKNKARLGVVNNSKKDIGENGSRNINQAGINKGYSDTSFMKNTNTEDTYDKNVSITDRKGNNGYSFDVGFMKNTTLPEDNKKDYVSRSSKRVSNPVFSETVKRLAPKEGSSRAERKDFNRQVNNIVRGNHSAIKPKEGSKSEYKMKNYNKALEIEKAYKKYNRKDD